MHCPRMPFVRTKVDDPMKTMDRRPSEETWERRSSEEAAVDIGEAPTTHSVRAAHEEPCLEDMDLDEIRERC